jgi:hypothetical protein
MCVQYLSDTSVRSYDSGRSLSSMGTYGSRASSYASLPSATADTRKSGLDRSLNYASLNRGNVNNIRDRFVSPSTDRMSSLDRLGTSSLTSRYASNTSVSPSSSRTSTLERHYDSSRPTSASRYGTDYGSTASKSTRDYSDYGSLSRSAGRDYVSTSTKLHTEPSALSPSSSSVRPTSTSNATKDDVGSGSSKSAVKHSAASLTPFTSSRVKATDSNLTPFSSRIGKTAISTDIDKVSSTAAKDEDAATHPAKSSVTSEEPLSPKPPTAVKNKAIDSDESSDSATEPDGGNKDARYRYLTSRATSPMEIDVDPFADSRSNRRRKGHRRLLSRTKTKRYDAKPAPAKTSRYLLSKQNNKDIQVDVKELDKYSGRVRVDRDKYRDRFKNKADAQYLQTLQNTQYNKTLSTSAYHSTTDLSRKNRKESESNDNHTSLPIPNADQDDDSSVRKPSSGSAAPTKQSSFKPKYNRRSSSENIFSDDQQPATLMAGIESSKQQPNSSQVETDTDMDDVFVPQSSFTSRKTLQKQTDSKKKLEVARSKILPLTSENLSLKESMDKVNSWKNQLSQESNKSGKGKLEKSTSKRFF